MKCNDFESEFRLGRVRSDVERAEKWREWVEKIPAIQFDPDWAVRVIPPFSGAMARFQVFKGDISVSVYLDVFSRLGCNKSPYWEVFPHQGDVFRCAMSEVDELLVAIRESIKEQEA